MVPARHRLDLGVDHRGGQHRGQSQTAAHPPQAAWPAQPKPIRQCWGGQCQQGRNSRPSFTRQPTAAPLAERLQRPLRVAQMEGGRQKPHNRKAIAQTPKRKSRPAVHMYKPKPQKRKQAKSHAREHGKHNDRRCRMHQIFPRILSSQPAKPLALMSSSGARTLASSTRSLGRGGR